MKTQEEINPPILENDAAVDKIKFMDGEEFLFLTIWYCLGVSYNGGSEYIELYKKSHDRFGIPYKRDFQQLFQLFLKEKILDGDGGSEYISKKYELAYEKSLTNPRINKFFTKFVLSNEKIDRGYGISYTSSIAAIAKNFPVLPKKVQNLLVEFTDENNQEFRSEVARSIIWNFNRLPKKIQNLILDKLIYDKNEIVRETILHTTDYRFDFLPAPFRESVLSKLKYPPIVIARHYPKLSPRIQNEFKKYVRSNFRKNIPAEVRKIAVWAIANSFQKLPATVQKELMRLADNQDPLVRREVSQTLSTGNFNNLPPELREELLQKFAGDSDVEVRRFATEAIVQNINQLSKKFIKIIEKLANDDDQFVSKMATEARLHREKV